MKPLINFGVSVKYQARLHDVKTGKVTRVYPWVKNLVNDIGLNWLAANTSAASAFGNCGIGSSNAPVSVASGAITFTQAGTSTITASSAFFTSGMVGSIIKYGSGTAGYEQYIATIGGGGLTCTVQASPGGFQTISGAVATVWNVQTQNLTQFLYNSGTYLTSSGSNGTSYTGANTQVNQRTFYFAPQSAAYTVNEVGWSNGAVTGPAPVAGVSQGASNSNNVYGRAVITSVTVGVTNFLSMVVVVSITYSPSVPSAVGNVNTNGGGGALNTAGNAMLEYFAQVYVDNSGTPQPQIGFPALAENFGGGATARFGLQLSNYSQQTTMFSSGTQPFPSIPATTAGALTYSVNIGPWVYVSSTTPTGGTVPPGVCQLTFSTAFTTNGETVYGLVLSAQGQPATFDIKLTTPFVLPVGTFPVSGTFKVQYGRTLSN
jgi:hypothetical protein